MAKARFDIKRHVTDTIIEYIEASAPTFAEQFVDLNAKCGVSIEADLTCGAAMLLK